MEESNIWIIGVVALVIGAVIGYLVGRSGNGTNQEHELEQAKLELDAYKEKVSSHFEETAELVNKMTESYRGVYQHLATGAAALCDADTARSIESTMQPQLTAQKEVKAEEVTESDDSTDESYVEPPRDYAPKKPDQEGTLSENYGVKDKDKKADSEEETEIDQDKSEEKVEETKKS